MPFFTDTFSTGSTVALNTHTSDSGHTWSLVRGSVVPSVFNAFNGVVANGGDSANALCICNPSIIAPSADVNIVTQFAYDSVNFLFVGITARSNADASAGYILVYGKTAQRWLIFRLRAGNAVDVAEIALSSVVTYSSGATPIVEFSVTGTGATVNLKVVVDSVELINFNDTSASRITTAGYTGIGFQVAGSAGQGMYIGSLTSSEVVTDLQVAANITSTSSLSGGLSIPGVFATFMSSQNTLTSNLSVSVNLIANLSSASLITSALSAAAVFNYLPNSFNYADRVRETSASVGTGSVSLAGTVTGFRAFSSAFNSGTQRIPYCIEDQLGANWEIGLGTYSTGVISRDTVFSSSNSNQLVNFTAGIKNVFVTLPANPITKFSTKDYIDLRDYNVDPTFTNDSTAGIQAAINDAYNLDIPVIKIPQGRYKIAGALGVSNAQLYIPNTRYIADKQKTIRFVGACVPNLEAQGLISIAPTNNGVIFESTIIGSSGSSLLRGEAPSQADSAPWNWNNTNVGFENMCFRVKADTQANPMTALNLDYFSQIISLDNLRIDTNRATLGSFDPSSVDSYGVKMPPVNNHAQFNGGTLLITGFTNGIILGEHACFKSLIMLGCTNAVVLGDGNHGSYIGHLLVECCKNSIKTNGQHPMFIGCYSSEHNNDGNWFDFNSDILLGVSPGTRKVVMGQSTIVKSHVGVDDTAWATNATSANYKIIAGAGAN